MEKYRLPRTLEMSPSGGGVRSVQLNLEMRVSGAFNSITEVKGIIVVAKAEVDVSEVAREVSDTHVSHLSIL